MTWKLQQATRKAKVRPWMATILIYLADERSPCRFILERRSNEGALPDRIPKSHKCKSKLLPLMIVGSPTQAPSKQNLYTDCSSVQNLCNGCIESATFYVFHRCVLLEQRTWHIWIYVYDPKQSFNQESTSRCAVRLELPIFQPVPQINEEDMDSFKKPLRDFDSFEKPLRDQRNPPTVSYSFSTFFQRKIRMICASENERTNQKTLLEPSNVVLTFFVVGAMLQCSRAAHQTGHGPSSGRHRRREGVPSCRRQP